MMLQNRRYLMSSASLEVLEDFFSFDLESLDDLASLLDVLLFVPRSDPVEGSRSLSLSSRLLFNVNTSPYVLNRSLSVL
ncbi:hypothetical protein Tco_0503016 [Tanacetum coccineum]